MALSAKLQLRQSQALVMTPQLMQSIRLLQFTRAELDRFIDEELERNPLVERDDANDAGTSETVETPEWSSEAMAEKLDSSLENVFPDDPGVADRLPPDLSAQWKSAAGSSGGTRTSEDIVDIGEITAAVVSLRDHVETQIAFAFRDAADRLIAGGLADGLDDAGYCRADLTEIADRLAAPVATVEAVLARCQTFDPSGLFARDLAECLAIQLREKDRFDPAMQALVANLDLLAQRDFVALKRLCGVDEEDLIAMAGEIRALDPKPGAGFAGGVSEPVTPDVLVKAAPDGTWSVELNPDALPRVLVNRDYYTQVAPHAVAGPEKAFIEDCLQSANWLARSLDQRARTILKVASEIVRRQDGFLVYGVSHLRPLNLRMVADAIAMHESTVSRVTSNKFMATPRGVFEMRYFFSAAIASSEGGEAHSSESVRHRIRQLIDSESAAAALSDDAIVDMLNREGIDIARRTVAKYREGMNIPSSVQRRREKLAVARAGLAVGAA
ncbi:MAG: RNA polymerase factor sigma-54 [Phyllobacteriaceae bacterium]|nr:RNA polymerase factor sigma-54 [Phyllobacteriaceae bacterium]